MVISDDIYEKIIYNDHPFSPLASLSEELKKLTIVVNGVSKTYAMTGWRIGYGAGPEKVIAGITKIRVRTPPIPLPLPRRRPLRP